MKCFRIGALILGTIALSAAWQPGHGAIIQAGDKVQAGLTATTPAKAFEFLPSAGGTLNLELRRGEADAPARLAVFRVRPNGSELLLAAAETLSSTLDTIYINPSAGRWHRAVLFLDEPGGEGSYEIVLTALDTTCSSLLLKGATESLLYTPGTSRIRATLPVGATGTFLFSPEGKWLLAGHGRYRLYDAFSGDFQGEIPGESTNPGFFFLPSLNRLLMSDPGKEQVLLYSIPDLAVLGQYAGKGFSVGPRSSRVVITGSNTASIVDPGDGSVVGTWSVAAPVEARISPEGRTVVLLAPTAVPVPVQWLDLESLTAKSPIYLWSALESVAFSPDGKRIALSGVNTEDDFHRAILYSTENGSPFQSNVIGWGPFSAAFSPQGQRLVFYPSQSAGLGVSAYVLNALSGQVLARYDGFRLVEEVRFHPLGETLLLKGRVLRDDLEEPEIKLIHAQTGSQVQQYNPFEIQKVAYNFRGDRFFILQKLYLQGLYKEDIRLSDGITGDLVRAGNGWEVSDWTAVNFSPDGSRLVSQFAGPIYSLSYLWRTSDGQQLFLDGYKEVSAFIESIQNQGFSLDSSRYFFVGGAYHGQSQSKLHIVNLGTGYRAQPDTIYERVEASALNPDGNTLALLCRREGDPRYYLETIRLSDGKPHRFAFTPPGTAQSLEWAPDGKRILGRFTGDSESLIIFETRPLSLLRTFQNNPSIQWDNTVFPRFYSFDFDGDAHIGGVDLFVLGNLLDPDYSETILEYQSLLWRNP